MELQQFDTIVDLTEAIVRENGLSGNSDKVIEVESDGADGQHMYSSEGNFVLLAKEKGENVFHKFKDIMNSNGFVVEPKEKCQLFGDDYKRGFVDMEIGAVPIMGQGGNVSFMNTFSKSIFGDPLKQATIENYTRADLRGTFRDSSVEMLELHNMGIYNVAGMLLNSNISTLTFNKCWITSDYTGRRAVDGVAGSPLYKMLGKEPSSLTLVNLINCGNEFVNEMLREFKYLSNLPGWSHVEIVIKDHV